MDSFQHGDIPTDASVGGCIAGKCKQASIGLSRGLSIVTDQVCTL